MHSRCSSELCSLHWCQGSFRGFQSPLGSCLVCLSRYGIPFFAFALCHPIASRSRRVTDLPYSCGDDSTIQTATSRQPFLFFSFLTFCQHTNLEAVSHHTQSQWLTHIYFMAMDDAPRTHPNSFDASRIHLLACPTYLTLTSATSFTSIPNWILMQNIGMKSLRAIHQWFSLSGLHLSSTFMSNGSELPQARCLSLSSQKTWTQPHRLHPKCLSPPLS